MADFFLSTVNALTNAKISSPRLEARLLLAKVLNCAAQEIYRDVVLNKEQQTQLDTLIKQRLRHKPLDKILGFREFYKYTFKVDENVLSPRPDTEILLEQALEVLQNIRAPKILDLGCGSGCIIESLLKELPNASGCAVDISEKALVVAKENAKTLQVSGRLRFINADWFASDFILKINHKFDVIVSNPPYIPSAKVETLDAEVKNYDPRQALDGGKSGYDSYVRIAQILPELLNDNGFVFLEAGAGQAKKIADIFKKQGFKLLKIVKDLAGIERCVVLYKS